jgi:RecA/RadA recombinase
MAKKDTSKMNLLDAFKSTIEDEGLGGYNEFQPVYKTGMDILDFRNGQLDINNDLSVGINGGKILTIIGKSGSAKTSLGIKIACNIVENYENGQVIHYDFEHATKYERVKALSGWDNEMIKEKYLILDKDIYTETLYAFVKAAAKLKTEKWEDIKIESGVVNDNGEPVYTYPPTVILVDSWALVIPKDYSEEEQLSGQMSSTAMARMNNQVIKRCAQIMGDKNITMIVINHITTKVDIGMMPTPAVLNYLKQDEAVPGGSSVIFMADALLRLQASTKLTPDKDYGIKGFVVNAVYAKTRSNEAGVPFEMVFNQARGFDNVLTNFHNLKKLKVLRGNGRAYYFDFAPDIKFTQKNIKEVYDSNDEFREKFDEYVIEVYSEYISNGFMNEEDEVEEVELTPVQKKISKKKIFNEWYDLDELIWIDTDGNYRDEDGDIVEVEEDDEEE